jgi:glycosyltransferase involved in cell wall biosynthesis
MRIVLINPYFSEGMGYLENCLSKALASLGHDVFVITSTGQVYFNQPFYEKTYGKFLGKPILEPVRKQIDGYELIRLPFRSVFGKVVLIGLKNVLKEIKPDIVQTFDPFSFLNIQAIIFKVSLNYKVFTANHIMKSVFPLAGYNRGERILERTIFFLTRTLPGKFLNNFIEMSFPITIDALDISSKFYSYPLNKLKIIPLGVDTQLFAPPVSDELMARRTRKREDLGIGMGDILCIYTGRFSEGKNPLCLAKAINKLIDEGEKYKGLFIGDGIQAEEIKKLKGCIITDFVLFNDLADLYAIGDIGVWPREESTSMLDAAASGLPLVISNTVQATERIKDIGFTYSENNSDDLAGTLLKLKDPDLRKELGSKGVERMRDQYSWIKMAEIRLNEFSKVL